MIRDAITCQTVDRFCSKLSVNALWLFLSKVSHFGFNWEKVSSLMPVYGRQKHRIFAYSACESSYAEFAKQVLGERIASDTVDRFSVHAATEPGGPANYNFLRGEFEYDFLPEAEVLLADADPVSDDIKMEGTELNTEPSAPTVTHLLPGALHAYNSVLDERERRRQFLVSMLHLKDFVPKRRKVDEREIFERLRIFVRPAATLGGSREVLESLATGLASERKQRESLAKFNAWRRNGVSNETEGDLLAYDTKKRADAQIKWLKRETSFDEERAENEMELRDDLSASNNSSAPPVSRIMEISPIKSTPIGSPPFLHNPLVSIADGSASKNRKYSLWATESLPGSDRISTADLAVCEKTGVAPQHFIVIRLVLLKLKELMAVGGFLPSATCPPEAYTVVRESVIGTIWNAQGKKIPADSGDHLKKLLVDHIWKGFIGS